MPNRWHRGSVYDGPHIPRVTLDREQRSRFRSLIHLARLRGRISQSTAEVGRVLCAALGSDGRLDLSIASIAARAACHVDTARRALAALRDRGFLTWMRRLVRTPGGCRQATNAYALALPMPTACLNAEQKNSVLSTAPEKYWSGSISDVAAARAALAKIAAARSLSLARRR